MKSFVNSARLKRQNKKLWREQQPLRPFGSEEKLIEFPTVNNYSSKRSVTNERRLFFFNLNALLRFHRLPLYIPYPIHNQMEHIIQKLIDIEMETIFKVNPNA